MINPMNMIASKQFKNVVIGVIIASVGLVGSVVTYTTGVPMYFLISSAVFDVGIIITLHQAYTIETRYNLGNTDAELAVEQGKELDEQMENMMSNPMETAKEMQEEIDEDFEDDEPEDDF